MDDFVTLLIVRAKIKISSSYALLSSFLHNQLDYGNINVFKVQEKSSVSNYPKFQPFFPEMGAKR
jgi:hypothetical protein